MPVSPASAVSPVIDLRSDILARPTETMLQAMVMAGRRARAYGYREDYDLQQMESLAANLLGKEDALFFPTCTMANQVALMTFCRPGQSFLIEATSHLATSEAASTIGVAGAVMKHLPAHQGHLDPEAVRTALNTSKAALLWLENTHNRAGGTVLPPERQREITAACRAHGVPVHVDGARIWNAAVALECSVAELTRDIDTVSISMNKCLGAPLGAVLAGSKSFIVEAERLRLLLGGGWRPTGIIAAAGLEALKALPLDIIAHDHRLARTMAEQLARYAWLHVDPVQTNIVIVVPDADHGSRLELIQALNRRNVLVTLAGDDGVRLVTYAQIRQAEVDAVMSVFDELDGVINAGGDFDSLK